jgi:hypothetical protein
MSVSQTKFREEKPRFSTCLNAVEDFFAAALMTSILVYLKEQFSRTDDLAK